MERFAKRVQRQACLDYAERKETKVAIQTEIICSSVIFKIQRLSRLSVPHYMFFRIFAPSFILHSHPQP